MQIAKWGNSLAVRLPASLVQELGLKSGDEIEVIPAVSQTAPTRLQVRRVRTREEIVEGLRRLADGLPEPYRFKRADAYDEKRGGG